MEEMQLLLTPIESARMLRIGRSTLYALLQRGDIPSVKIGASRRIEVSALLYYLDDLAERGRAESDVANSG